MTLPTYRATALLGITSITARPAACQTAACPKPGVECRSAIGASRSLPGAAIKVCLLNRLPTLDLAGGDYPSCPFAVTAQSQPPTLSGRESCHSFHAIGWASHGNADAIVNEYSLSNRCTTAALRRAFPARRLRRKVISLRRRQVVGRISHKQARSGSVPLTGSSAAVPLSRLMLAPSGPNGS